MTRTSSVVLKEIPELYTNDIKHTQRYWLRRIINPKGQQPFWILGDSIQPYIDFVSYLAFWQQQLPATRANRFQSVVLAYYCANENRPPHPTFWIAKTPDNEHHVQDILTFFPSSRFIHILRNPGDTVRSLEKRAENLNQAFNRHHTIQMVNRSFQTGQRNYELLTTRYSTVKYEDILSDSETTMKQVLDIIGVSVG